MNMLESDMNQRVKTLVDDIRKLTPDERLELMAELATVIDNDAPADGTPEEIEAAWMEEVEKRIDARDRGEGQTFSSEEVVAAARARIAKAWK